MKINSLLLLAEYFSRMSEVSFCLMYEAEDTSRGFRNLAIYLDTAVLGDRDPMDLVRKIELEVKTLLKRQDLAFVCLNTASETLKHRVIETSVPVFCRDERPMTDYCRRIYREDVSQQKKFNFKNMSGFSLMIAL